MTKQDGNSGRAGDDAGGADAGRERLVQRLSERWRKLARTRSCRFFVASHPGWRDERRWQQVAVGDAAMVLSGLEPARLAQTDVLEIGCGIGRLARPLLASVRSWSGCDIAPEMVARAREELASVGARARVAVSDGARVPDELRDRAYGLIVSWAVLIHCPKPVIDSLVTDAIALLAPGGRLRCQVLADLDDPTGITPGSPDAEAVHRSMVEIDEGGQEEARPEPEDAGLTGGGDYLGHEFGYEEACRFFARPGGEATIHRFDRRNMYCDFVRDG